MPKKPLSMYMLFYSKKRAKIIANNPTLTMPEVAKICSEQYQVLVFDDDITGGTSCVGMILFLF